MTVEDWRIYHKFITATQGDTRQSTDEVHGGMSPKHVFRLSLTERWDSKRNDDERRWPVSGTGMGNDSAPTIPVRLRRQLRRRLVTTVTAETLARGEWRYNFELDVSGAGPTGTLLVYRVRRFVTMAVTGVDRHARLREVRPIKDETLGEYIIRTAVRCGAVRRLSCSSRDDTQPTVSCLR